jgi:hypothetical protein
MGMDVKPYLEAIIKDEELRQWEGLYTHLSLKEKEPLFPTLKEIRVREREEKMEIEREREFEIAEIFQKDEDLCIIGDPGAGRYHKRLKVILS